jgi:NADH:ubiquinone reductase (H+-translocating)
VIFNWIISFFAGRDTTQLMDLDNPRGAFVAAAAPAPKPAAAAPAAPAAPTSGGSGSSAVESKETVTAEVK